MVQAGGRVLLKEQGVTTVLMVTQSFLAAHPAIVTDLLKANLEAIDYIKSNPAAAAAAANGELAAYTGKPLKASVLTPAFAEITFTADPDAVSFNADAQQAKAVGLLSSADLSGIFDLGPLNSLLAAAGGASVSDG
jgi:NitT/TauT family transport system substrate-binding protein